MIFLKALRKTIRWVVRRKRNEFNKNQTFTIFIFLASPFGSFICFFPKLISTKSSSLFLIENDVISIEKIDAKLSIIQDASVTIPNGNYDISGSGFYVPLNLEIPAGTTVTWVNDDSVPHTIQSQDEFGNVIALFNSAPLNTGDKFEYIFEEAGVYNYFCSFHPWRVGVVTVK